VLAKVISSFLEYRVHIVICREEAIQVDIEKIPEAGKRKKDLLPQNHLCQHGQVIILLQIHVQIIAAVVCFLRIQYNCMLLA
jgi:hypothetical protein